MTAQTTQAWPDLGAEGFAETRSGLHAFARLLGAYPRACAPRRRHWWHISLKPAVGGFRTGVLRSNECLFELVLNFDAQNITLVITGEDAHEFSIQGESAASLKKKLDSVLSRHPIAIEVDDEKIETGQYQIDQETASKLGQVYGRLAQCLARFRAGLPAETSPIQLWPHHFDLAMLVLTGRKIPGHDPENEEYSDEQLNFGFVPGDDGIREPYFFITLYDHAERLAGVSLRDEAYFHTDGWNGIVMLYNAFRKCPQAESILLNLWQPAWELAHEETGND